MQNITTFQTLLPAVDVEALNASYYFHVQRRLVTQIKNQTNAVANKRLTNLNFIALEKVNIWFALARFLANECQDGVIVTGIHHRLKMLDCVKGKVLQLIL